MNHLIKNNSEVDKPGAAVTCELFVWTVSSANWNQIKRICSRISVVIRLANARVTRNCRELTSLLEGRAEKQPVKPTQREANSSGLKKRN